MLCSNQIWLLHQRMRRWFIASYFVNVSLFSSVSPCSFQPNVTLLLCFFHFPSKSWRYTEGLPTATKWPITHVYRLLGSRPSPAAFPEGTSRFADSLTRRPPVKRETGSGGSPRRVRPTRTTWRENHRGLGQPAWRSYLARDLR